MKTKQSIEEKIYNKLQKIDPIKLAYGIDIEESIIKLIKNLSLKEFIELKGYIWSDNDFNGNDLYKDENGQEFDLTEIINR